MAHLHSKILDAPLRSIFGQITGWGPHLGNPGSAAGSCLLRNVVYRSVCDIPIVDTTWFSRWSICLVSHCEATARLILDPGAPPMPTRKYVD